MGKNRKKYVRRPHQPPRSLTFILDEFSVEDIHRWQEMKEKTLKYHWDYYNNLAFQRSRISDKLSEALLEGAEKTFPFPKWQRVTKYKYAMEPFSVEGSLVDPGGRFNIGKIDPSRFPPIPALYIACDKKTALQETLSQKIKPGKEQIALDFALSASDSIVNISVSGMLDSIINLHHPQRLKKFVDLIKGFTFPDELVRTAKEIKLPAPTLIRNIDELLSDMLEPNWRMWPMQFDVPTTSQIFGQLVANAGIEGILFPSKFSGKDCLAIFPQNFTGTDSYVELDDPAPAEVRILKLDAATWAKITPSGA